MKAFTKLAKWKKVTLLLFFFLIAFGSGYYLLTALDWSILSTLNSRLLLILIVVALLYILVAAFSTWVLLRGMGYSVSFPTLALVHSVSLSSSYTTPVKAGIPVRVWLYETLFSIPLIPGSMSIMVEMVLGVFINSVLSVIGALFFLNPTEVTALLILSGGVLLVVLGIRYFNPQKLTSETGFLARLVNRLIHWWQKALDSIRCVSKLTLLAVAGLYLVRLFIRALCLRYVLFAFGTDPAVFQLLFIECISGLVGLISMLPMGIGAKDASLVALLLRIGITPESAFAAALIDRTLWTLVPIVVGFVAANVLGVKSLVLERKAQGDL